MNNLELNKILSKKQQQQQIIDHFNGEFMSVWEKIIDRVRLGAR